MADNISTDIATIFPSENCYFLIFLTVLYPPISKKKNSGDKQIKEELQTGTQQKIDLEVVRKLYWLKVSVEPWQQVEKF